MKNARLILSVFLVLLVIFSTSCELIDKNEGPLCSFYTPLTNSSYEKGEVASFWVDASDPDGSISEISLYIDGAKVTSTQTPPLTYQWDTGLEEVGSYTANATATDNEGAVMSEEITVIVGPVFLAKPNNLIILYTAVNEIKLDWDNVDKADSYNIFWTDDETDPNINSNKISNWLAANYEHSSLSYENTYTYRIQAVKGEFTSELSNSVSGSPAIPPLEKTENVYTVELDNSIAVYWDALSYTGVTYSIQRKESTYGSYSTLISNLTSTSYEDGVIEAGKGYFYKVIAYDPGSDRQSESDPAYGVTIKTIYESEINNQNINNTLYYDTHYWAAEDVTYGLDKFRIRGGYSGAYGIYSAGSYKWFEADCFSLDVESGDVIEFRLIDGEMSGLWSMTVSIQGYGNYSTGSDYDAQLNQYNSSWESWTFQPSSSGTYIGTYLKISMWEDLINYGPYNYEVEIIIHRQP